MSATVDSRIVSMKMDNKQFEAGASKTLATLNLLSKSLDMLGNRKGMADLQTQANRFNMNQMSSAVEGVSARFLALSTIAITALSNITNRAVNAGTSFVKSFSIDPIQQGLHEYETNLKSIQVIQANTDQPLTKINKSLQELNAYSDQTIYNFSEMAKNIGTFTAAGVGLEDATSAIKGIANMAALSGSSSEQAAGAMYQLSQAIAAGKVGAQDWNSVVNAGMAGKKLQTALAQTAVAMDVLGEGAVENANKAGEALKINGDSFKNSIMALPGQESWLTSDVLVNTLASLDGRFSAAALSVEKLKDGTLRYKDAAEVTAVIDKNRAELAKQGVKFTDEQFEAMKKLSDASFKSATEVKTLGQVFDVAKESIGSGWSASFQNIFGNLKQAKKTFTEMSNFINGFIEESSLARNELLSEWRKGGGRNDLIEGLKAGFKALLSFMKPIRDAFRDIFPKKTASDLIALTASFREFMEGLSLGQKNSENLRATFRGLFAALDIGWQIIKGLVGVVMGLFGAIDGGNGGILEFTGNIGDFITNLRDALKEGNGLTAFFEGLGKVLQVPIDLLSNFGEFLSDMIKKLGDLDFGPILEAFSGLGDGIKGVISGDINGIMGLVGVGLLGGIYMLIKNFFTGGGLLDSLLGGKAGGMIEAITDTFGTLTDTLENMQQNVKATIILKIAAAVALLAGSMAILSTINAKDLAKSLTAMAVGFGQLLIAMGIMAKIAGIKGIFVISSLAKSMVVLGLALVILAAGLKILSGMSWEEIGRGLAAMAGILAVIVGFSAAMAKVGKGIVFAGLAMVPLAAGIAVLVGAVALMASMSWKELGRGLAGLAGALTIVSIAVNSMGLMAPIAGAGLLITAVALGMIAGVLKALGSMSWEEIGKSMAALAGALTIIGLALAGISGWGILGAAALLIVAPALIMLAGVMKVLGSMSWKEIAKGLVALGGALTILAIGLTAMIIGLPGAAALLVAAPALAVLAGVMVTLGSLKWSTIAKGLAAIAGLFVVLGVGATLLAPVLPALFGLTVVLMGLGAAMLLAGGGMFLFATALSQLAIDGKEGATVITGMFTSFLELIPLFFTKLGEGLVKLAEVIVTAAPTIVAAVVSVGADLLEGFNQLLPQIGILFTTLIETGLQVLRDTSDDFVQTGFTLLMNLLDGFRENSQELADKVVKVVQALANSFGSEENVSKMAQAAADLLVNFLNGFSDAVDKKSGKIAEAAGKLTASIGAAILKSPFSFAEGLADKIASEITKGIEWAKSKLPGGGGGGSGGSAGNMEEQGGVVPRAVGRAFTGAVAEGIADNTGVVENAGTQMVARTLTAINMAMDANFDWTPTITPILDLTQLQNDTTSIGGMLAVPISTLSSYSQASSIIDDYANPESSDDSSPSDGATIKFEQNNYSPKALSPAEIFLQTKNQIALAEEALNK